MKRLISSLFAICLLTVAAFAQDKPAIRSPNIDTTSPEGQLLTQAGMAEAAADKIPVLEAFVEKYPQSEYLGYAYFQLMNAYSQAEKPAEAAKVGLKLIEIAPEDLEVRHGLNQALLASRQWDALAKNIEATRPLAAAEAAAPPPADESEKATWQAGVDYAAGVAQWLEWATNAAMTQQSDPAAKVAWLERLHENYPDGQYSQGIEDQFVAAYQQAGNQEKAVEWMKRSAESETPNPFYLYSLGEDALDRDDREAAKKYGEALVAYAEGDKPEGVAEADWEEQSKKFAAYGRFVLGRCEASKNTKQAYRDGRAHLLQTVDYLKAEGGPRYHVLAYFLGVCYVQLDIAGDNIQKATMWMGEAARTDGPFQAQAKDALSKIQGAR